MKCSECVLNNYRYCFDSGELFASRALSAQTSGTYNSDHCLDTGSVCTGGTIDSRGYSSKSLELAACENIVDYCGTLAETTSTLTDIGDFSTTAMLEQVVGYKCSYNVKFVCGAPSFAMLAAGDTTGLEIDFIQWTNDDRVTMDSTYYDFPEMT